MFGIARFVFIFALAATLWACGGQSDDATAPSRAVSGAKLVAQVDTDRITAAAEEPEMWLTYGGTYDEQRHSALGQINRDTPSVLFIFCHGAPSGLIRTNIYPGKSGFVLVENSDPRLLVKSCNGKKVLNPC